MNNPPSEAQELIQEFQRQEAAARANRPPKPKRAEIRAGERNKKDPPLTTQAAEKLAREAKLEIHDGGGKHGKHIVDPTTGERVSLPDHGGSHNLSTGVAKIIRDFITSHSRKPQ